MIVVTCFSEKGFEETGRESLKSFVKYWPCRIIAYHEGPEPDLVHPNIEYRPFFDIDGVRAFLGHLLDIPRSNGVVDKDGKAMYNYNYDIWKFCRKLFAQYDVLQEHHGKVFWLDNDVITKKKIPEKFLSDLFEDKHLVFLGRKKFHSETGFVGFDTNHDAFPAFLVRYIDCIRRGIVFSLPRWHDCAVFDWARNEEGKDLSEFWRKNDCLDVWPKTVLGEYMVHFKGSRKGMVNDIG